MVDSCDLVALPSPVGPSLWRLPQAYEAVMKARRGHHQVSYRYRPHPCTATLPDGLSPAPMATAAPPLVALWPARSLSGPACTTLDTQASSWPYRRERATKRHKRGLELRLCPFCHFARALPSKN